ncbi:MAG: hypothetical protein F4232_08735 [Acidimicrobiaceae bacterium]|nr:hypothetical protein [Acidimicrobiaceae bacterium]
MELPPPSEDLALAGERWCDVVHRRERYRKQLERLSDAQRDWSIDDAITENLALPELLRDYMSQLADAAECETAFEVLRSLTVCDPTVGSGAFLFAALDVLEPLYAEVLARAEEFEADGKPVPGFLAESRTHPSSRYWLIKTICLRNLFGVDLMQEAPEIAKLRLFLKLAAQIDRVEDLEPLPDLDFNIKCGNLLVGIADDRDAAERLFSQRLDHVAQLQQVEETAKQIADAFDDYIAAEAADTGRLDHTGAKQKLQARLQAARNLADTLLHEMRDETDDFEAWRRSHQPFHWFVEFPSVWRNGGFDVVIGNPPYIKKSLVTDYTWVGYKTQKCPDLYAICMERASTLLNDQGRFAMIVMHSLCFSREFLTLREFLRHAAGKTWVSSYAKRPDLLFAGSADVRNSIISGCRRRRDKPEVLTTRCNRWLSGTRDRLFHNLEFGTADALLMQCVPVPQWPFSDPAVEKAIGYIAAENAALSSSLVNGQTEHHLGFKTVARYFLSIFKDEPPTLDPHTGRPATTKSKRAGWLHFNCAEHRDLALVMLAGRWGYLWWMTYGDEFHVTRSTLAAFPGDIERLAKRTPGDMELVILLELSRTLQEQMPKHLAWQTNAGVKVGRYNMLKLRHITDRADWILAKAWGIEDAFEASGNLRDRMVFGNKE